MDLGLELARSNRSMQDALADYYEAESRKAKKADDQHGAIVNLSALGMANLASEFYKQLIQQIQEFDTALDQEHEVGVRLVSFGQSVTFAVEDVGYINPSLIVFSGISDDGQRVRLIQHVTQLSFLLVVLKRQHPEEPKKKFGFCPPEAGSGGSPNRAADAPP